MNLLFSTNQHEVESLTTQGNEYLGSGDYKGLELHVFAEREVVPVDFNKPLVVSNAPSGAEGMYEITVLRTDSRVKNGYENLIYLKNNVQSNSDMILHVDNFGWSSNGEFIFANVAESVIEHQVSLLMELLSNLDGYGSECFDVSHEESSILSIMQQPRERDELKLALIGFLMDHPTIELRRKT